MRYENQTFTSETLEVDGRIFIRCTFKDCELVYRGGVLPIVDNCSLDNIRLTFRDAAGNTVLFLAQFSQSGFSAQIQTLMATLQPDSSNDAMIVIDNELLN